MIKDFLKNRKIKKYARKMPKKLATEFGNKTEYSEEEIETILKIVKLYKNDRAGNSYAIAMYCSNECYLRYLASSPGIEDYESARELIRSVVFPDASSFNFSSLLIDASNPYDASSGNSHSNSVDHLHDTGDSGGGSE